MGLSELSHKQIRNVSNYEAIDIMPSVSQESLLVFTAKEIKPAERLIVHEKVSVWIKVLHIFIVY